MTHERRILAAVFAGGVAGTLLRAALTEAWPPESGHWPWATFLVNIAGAALIGWIMGREPTAARSPPTGIRCWEPGSAAR